MSFIALLACSIAFVSAGVCATLVVLPSNELTALSMTIQKELDQLQLPLGSSVSESRDRTRGMILIFLALLSFTVFARTEFTRNAHAVEDQFEYIKLAHDIREQGGSSSLLQRLYSGVYEEDNRHPLYPWLLSLTLPENCILLQDGKPVSVNSQGFRTAKLNSLCISFLTLSFCTVFLARVFGIVPAGIVAVLLSSNSLFIQSSSLIACESLLILLMTIAWLSLVRCRHRPRLAPVVLGLSFGLSYLTKATVLPLILLSLVCLLWSRSMRGTAIIATMVFLLISSPLLVRNTTTHGNPFHNFNSRYLFADEFDPDRSYEGFRSEAADYFSSHSPLAIARRITTGWAWEGFIAARSFGPASLGQPRPAVGGIVLLLALLCGVLALRCKAEHGPSNQSDDAQAQTIKNATVEMQVGMKILAGWTLVCFLMFAWYVPIAAGDRFWAPTLGPIVICAALGLTAAFSHQQDLSTALRRTWWAGLFWGLSFVLLNTWRTLVVTGAVS